MIPSSKQGRPFSSPSPRPLCYQRSSRSTTYRSRRHFQDKRKTTTMLLLAWNGQRHQQPHKSMSPLSTAKNRSSTSTGTSYAATSTHRAQHANARWFAQTSQNLRKQQKVHPGHDWRLYKIRWTCGNQQQRSRNHHGSNLQKVDMLIWRPNGNHNRSRKIILQQTLGHSIQTPGNRTLHYN